MSIKKTSLWIAITVAGMLITGAVNTIVKKLQNNWVAPGLNPRPHKFEHPWFQSLVMFMGEMVCLIGLAVERYQLRKINKSIVDLDINRIDKDEVVSKKIFSWVFVLPSIGDIIGSSVAGIGLLWVSASIWQMMRGSIIIFSGILSVIFLKKKLEKHNWIGMAVVVLGLAVVGVSGFLAEKNQGSSSNNNSLIIIGIILILFGQLMNAIQMIMEESFLKHGNYSALNVVGMEGVFGFAIMVLIVLPICYFLPGDDSGSYENIIDALYQLKNSAGLILLNIAMLLSIAFYNYFGLIVAKELSTIHRTLIDALRTILVWITSIIIYYAGAKSLGEKWQGGYSLLQLLGFAFLLIGTIIYNGSYQIIIKFIKEKMGKKKDQNEETERLIDEELDKDK